jgi:hypothetical protein
MKFIKIFLEHRQADEKEVRAFIEKNMSQEMANGLEHDDPKAIKRALKLFGIEYDSVNKTSVDMQSTKIKSTKDKSANK